MNNNNFESMMSRVMEGQESAQQNLVNIVRGVFDFAGFDTLYLNNPMFGMMAKMAAHSELFELTEQLKGKSYVETMLDTVTKGVSTFLSMDDADIEKMNSMSEEYQYGLFQQVVTFLNYGNQTKRVELVGELLQMSMEYTGTEEDMVSARAWQLFLGLLVPDMAA